MLDEWKAEIEKCVKHYDGIKMTETAKTAAKWYTPSIEKTSACVTSTHLRTLS